MSMCDFSGEAHREYPQRLAEVDSSKICAMSSACSSVQHVPVREKIHGFENENVRFRCFSYHGGVGVLPFGKVILHMEIFHMAGSLHATRAFLFRETSLDSGMPTGELPTCA